MTDTTITITGNLTADPSLRFLASGAPVANFTVASTPRTFDKNTSEWKDGETLFLNCSAWRQTAENVAESLTKGMGVIVTGKLKARTFQNREGQDVTRVEIDVEDVGPSLKHATAKATRTTSGQARQPRPQADPWAAPTTTDEPPF